MRLMEPAREVNAALLVLPAGWTSTLLVVVAPVLGAGAIPGGLSAQAEEAPAAPRRTHPYALHMAGGLSRQAKGTGLSAGLGGGVTLGLLQVSLTAIHGTWIPVDPEPGYRRLYSIMGSIICQDLETREMVDERHCDDTSTEVGAMAELALALTPGPRSLYLGGGYRFGDGRGGFASFTWGPRRYAPGGSWFLTARVGSDFLEGVAGVSFWPRRGTDGGSDGQGSTRDPLHRLRRLNEPSLP